MTLHHYLLTSPGSSCTPFLASSSFPAAQAPGRRRAAGERTPVGTGAARRAGSLPRCPPRRRIRFGPTG